MMVAKTGRQALVHGRQALLFALAVGGRVARWTWGAASEAGQHLANLAARPRYYSEAALANGLPQVFLQPRTLSGFVAEYPIATAFLISLMIHLLLFGTWRWGKHLGWWEHQATWMLHWSKKAKPMLSPAQVQKFLEARQRAQERVIPMTFVEVDPAAAVTEPPKDAKFYGVQNAKAANPDAVLDTNVPKIDGKQDKTVRLQDTERPRPEPLQPALPAPPKDLATSEPKVKAEAPGDLKLAKPEDGARDAVAVVRDRPRTLAAARQQKAMLAGETMKQDGGVSRRGKYSLDVKQTPFGAYDAALIAAVQQRWYDLLDNARFAQRAGKVVLQFRLTYDGRITDMKVNENEVGEILGWLCQRAVMDPQPFAKWPSDMRRAVGRDYREVLFTFHYH